MIAGKPDDQLPCMFHDPSGEIDQAEAVRTCRIFRDAGR
jgi:hypothetical protein